MRLNLGSGQRPFGAGWINVDRQARFNPDVVSDGMEYLGTLDPGSVEIIVLHHVLEHFGCGEAEPLIRECHRVLVPGGSVLIFVPDMAALARMWIEGRLTTETYMINVYGAYMGAEEDRHKWGFDRLELRKFLRYTCAPWSNVVDFNWRSVPGADFARAEWVLAQEAVK